MEKSYHSKEGLESHHNFYYKGSPVTIPTDGKLKVQLPLTQKLCISNQELVEEDHWNYYSEESKIVHLNYFHNSTKEPFHIGTIPISRLAPSIYPDHGDFVIGIPEQIFFEVSARKLVTIRIVKSLHFHLIVAMYNQVMSNCINKLMELLILSTQLSFRQ